MERPALSSADEAAQLSGVDGFSPSKAGTASDQEAMRRLGKQQLLKVHLPPANLLWADLSAAQPWLPKHLRICPCSDGNLGDCSRYRRFRAGKRWSLRLVVYVHWRMDRLHTRCDIDGRNGIDGAVRTPFSAIVPQS
jgi:hypothetical protein